MPSRNVASPRLTGKDDSDIHSRTGEDEPAVVNTHDDLIGIGLYTVPEAARLARVPAAKIRGWINGYGPANRAPVIKRELTPIAGRTALSFLDLIEVRFVSWLVNLGISWKTIRTAAERAWRELRHDHPFALARFKTDGRNIFLEVQRETDDHDLLDLIKNNFAMYDVLEQSFREGLDFESGVVSSWRPKEGNGAILLDPERAFGQPIEEVSGIPTSTLADAYRAEGSFARVASWFDVPEAAVRNAVTYELALAA